MSNFERNVVKENILAETVGRLQKFKSIIRKNYTTTKNSGVGRQIISTMTTTMLSFFVRDVIKGSITENTEGW